MSEPPTPRRIVQWLEGLVPAELRRDALTRRRSLLAVGFIGAIVVVAAAIVPFLLLARDDELAVVAAINTACFDTTTRPSAVQASWYGVSRPAGAAPRTIPA